jgi:hypothetical protein
LTPDESGIERMRGGGVGAGYVPLHDDRWLGRDDFFFDDRGWRLRDDPLFDDDGRFLSGGVGDEGERDCLMEFHGNGMLGCPREAAGISRNTRARDPAGPS